MAQLVAKSLMRLLTDGFATKGNIPVVHKDNLTPVISETLGIAFSSSFPQWLD